MAQYATQAEFLDQGLPSSCFADLAGSTIDTALIWASARVSSFIKKRVSLPLVSWSEDLREATCALAARKLIRRRGIDNGSGNNKEIIDWYKEEMAWLLQVSKGDAEIADYVDSTPTIDEAAPLASSDKIVDWNYSMRDLNDDDELED